MICLAGSLCHCYATARNISPRETTDGSKSTSGCHFASISHGMLSLHKCHKSYEWSKVWEGKKHIKTYKKLKETTWLMLLCRSIMFNQHPTSDAARQHPGITWPSYSGSLNLMKHRLVKTFLVFLYWWGASTIHLSITLHIDPAIGCYSKMNDYNNDYWMLCFFFNLPAFT